MGGYQIKPEMKQNQTYIPALKVMLYMSIVVIQTYTV